MVQLIVFFKKIRYFIFIFIKYAPLVYLIFLLQCIFQIWMIDSPCISLLIKLHMIIFWIAYLKHTNLLLLYVCLLVHMYKIKLIQSSFFGYFTIFTLQCLIYWTFNCSMQLICFVFYNYFHGCTIWQTKVANNCFFNKLYKKVQLMVYLFY
jgi:hypothetical protein